MTWTSIKRLRIIWAQGTAGVFSGVSGGAVKVLRKAVENRLLQGGLHTVGTCRYRGATEKVERRKVGVKRGGEFTWQSMYGLVLSPPFCLFLHSFCVLVPQSSEIPQQ